MSETAEPQVATAEAAPVETKTESTGNVPAPKESASSQLLQHARKEADALRKEVGYKKELASMQEKIKSYEDEVGYFRNAKETYKSNPEELLNKLGISYDSLTDAVVQYYENKDKNVKPPSADEIRKQIEEEVNKREQAKQYESVQNTLVSFVSEIEDFVSSKEQEYPHLAKLAGPLANTSSPGELIYNIVQNYFNETGDLLDLETAASTAEEYLQGELEKLTGSKIKKETESPKENVVSSRIINTGKDSSSAEASVQKSKFKLNDLPTITNNMRPTTQITRSARDNRMDVIDRAVAALSANARK